MVRMKIVTVLTRVGRNIAIRRWLQHHVLMSDEGIVHAVWKHRVNMNKARLAEAGRGMIQLKLRLLVGDSSYERTEWRYECESKHG